MDNNKALSLYGYGACFFKATWDIIRVYMVKAIKHFFSIGYLFKEINCTIHSFVLKVNNPYFCKDLCPITCYNTIYKCITKILVNCLKRIFPSFVNKAQGENILLQIKEIYSTRCFRGRSK